MLREHNRSLRSLLLLFDIVLCGVIYVGAQVRYRGGVQLEPSGLALSLVAIFALPLAIRALGGCTHRFETPAQFRRSLLSAAGLSGLGLGATAYAVGASIPAGLLFGIFGVQFAAVAGTRIFLVGSVRWLRRHGRNYRNVIVIGTGPRAVEFSQTIERHPEWGLRLVGYVDEQDVPIDDAIPADRVHKLADFPDVIRGQVIDEVIAACPRSMLVTLGPVVGACSEAGIPLTIMTDLFGDYLPPPRAKSFGSIDSLSFARVHHDDSMLAVKRGFDILGASIGLIVAAPVLLLGAIAVKLSSPGPIFFRQIRCGLYGRPFVMYKLRTMVCDAESRREQLDDMNEMDGPVFKIRRDPRITRSGRLLRAFSIDELPQFFSVLMGDMSLVGPRPPIPSEVAQYKNWERRRLSMRPGLTCIWQVSGRNELSFEEWVRLDLEYIDHWSVGQDLRLLALTIPTVLRGTGR